MDLGIPNTKVYAEVLEQTAITQFAEAMALECNVQGALMPDSHTGYTLPIGAVIKSDGRVFPSYVGYDIGCTDKDTEYLTESGWVKISDYNNEKV